MSKTQITGKRIRDNTIFLRHLSPDLMLSEDYLNLNFPTHDHAMNKSALDKFRYTGTKELLDLKLLDDLMLEVISARRKGNNLGGTIDLKADKSVVEELQQEILAAGENGEGIATVIQNFKVSVQGQIDAHKGAITHEQLDGLYSDYQAAKNGDASLNDRLTTMESQIGTGTGTGTMTINTLNQWTHYHTIADDGLGNPVTTFTIPYDFVPNANTLQIFEGPILLRNGIDYTERTGNEITIISEAFIDMELTIMGTSNFSLWTWHETKILNLNQAIITLTNTYNPNSGEIVVYEEGLLLRKDIDYIEKSNNEIELLEILPENSVIEIFRRR